MVLDPVNKILSGVDKKLKPDKFSENKGVFVCRFNSDHVFDNYEDYAFHMTRVERSQP